MVVGDFNTAAFIRSRVRRLIPLDNPTLPMTHTKITMSTADVNRLSDLNDLAELLLPANRNQQHAFLAVYLTLKWADQLVPNLAEVARRHGVSKRTLERVRSKMRRLGLIEHVSRFNSRYGGQEGWLLSTRFESSLRRLADKAAMLRKREPDREEKERLLLELADARRSISRGEQL